MNCKLLSLAIIGLALSGCVPPPAPQVAVVTPPAPLPVAVVEPVPVALIPVVPPPQSWHRRAARVMRPAMHHRWVRRYSTVRVSYSPAGCGSVVHPCDVEHDIVPIQ